MALAPNCLLWVTGLVLINTRDDIMETMARLGVMKHDTATMVEMKYDNYYCLPEQSVTIMICVLSSFTEPLYM